MTLANSGPVPPRIQVKELPSAETDKSCVAHPLENLTRFCLLTSLLMLVNSPPRISFPSVWSLAMKILLNDEPLLSSIVPRSRDSSSSPFGPTRTTSCLIADNPFTSTTFSKVPIITMDPSVCMAAL